MVSELYFQSLLCFAHGMDSEGNAIKPISDCPDRVAMVDVGEGVVIALHGNDGSIRLGKGKMTPILVDPGIVVIWKEHFPIAMIGETQGHVLDGDFDEDILIHLVSEYNVKHGYNNHD